MKVVDQASRRLEAQFNLLHPSKEAGAAVVRVRAGAHLALVIILHGKQHDVEPTRPISHIVLMLMGGAELGNLDSRAKPPFSVEKTEEHSAKNITTSIGRQRNEHIAHRTRGRVCEEVEHR